VHDLEELNLALISFALFGSWLLGWPVFFGLFSATAISWLLARPGAGLRDGIITNALGTSAAALSLAWAGAALGLRDASSPVWIVRVLVCVALLVGLSRLLKDMQSKVESRNILLAVVAAGLCLSVLVARQNMFWIPVAVSIVALFILSNKPGKWHRYGMYLVEFVLGFIAFIALFVPEVIRHL
jgi:hypothetical protein